MEAKMERCREHEFGTGRLLLPSRRGRPVCEGGFFAPSIKGKAGFYLTVLASRNGRNYMKIKSRCRCYPSQKREGRFRSLWLLSNVVLAQN